MSRPGRSARRRILASAAGGGAPSDFRIWRRPYERRCHPEDRAVPQRGPRQRDRPRPRAAVADRDDAARGLPHARSRSTCARRATTPSASQKRLGELGTAATRSRPASALAETVVGQALALGKTPLDLVRGTGGEEKVLKNAKDACATEALEIATYTALERLARAVGDDETAHARRLDPRRRGADARRVLKELPKLTDAVVRADVKGDRSYDVATTGAADAVREAGDDGQARPPRRRAARPSARPARPARCRASRTPRARSRAPSPPRGPADRPLRQAHRGRDRRQARRALADRPRQGRRLRAQAPEPHDDPRPVSTLRGDEPWPGYDELTVAEIRAALADADEDRVEQVRDYERAHKNRAGVLEATERELGNA